ncbi:MAG: hypothetical protein HKN23_09945 [Verrucomicrobiales bacterium]|nr:hypothetical protein [Verrucomicrobiales bacterium]
MSNTDRERIWRNLAKQLVLKVNTGWWLQMFTPMLVIASLLVGTTILILRTLHQPISNAWFIGGAALVIFAAFGGAWLLASRRFIKSQEGLVRLEEGLSLRNALTAADHGVGKWPEVPKDDGVVSKSAGFEWRWPVVTAPFFVAVVAIAASVLIPIPEVEAVADLPPAEPSAWEQMEDILATLEEEEVIEEEAIEEVKEKIEELRKQPEDEWFGHSSMEATDTLRETLRQQINNLGKELETAERDLNALQNFAAEMSEEGKDMIMAEYDKALKNMELSSLPLNKELMEQLKGIDPKQLAQMQLNQLTKEQMDQLREQLKKAAGACKDCQGLGAGKEGGMPKMGEMSAEMRALLGRAKMGGKGGINRGPGPAPMFFGDETDLKTNNIEGVKNQDMSRAVPGELLGVGETEHELDKVKTGPTEAGAVKSKGQGGDTVWRDSLMPSEKAVLKKYFK